MIRFTMTSGSYEVSWFLTVLWVNELGVQNSRYIKWVQDSSDRWTEGVVLGDSGRAWSIYEEFIDTSYDYVLTYSPYTRSKIRCMVSTSFLYVFTREGHRLLPPTSVLVPVPNPSLCPCPCPRPTPTSFFLFLLLCLTLCPVPRSRPPSLCFRFL